MAGYRHLFMQLMHRVASQLPTRLLMRCSQQSTFLPFYHAIADEPLPHIRQLYTLKSSRQFIADYNLAPNSFSSGKVLASNYVPGIRKMYERTGAFIQPHCRQTGVRLYLRADFASLLPPKGKRWVQL